MDEETKSEKKLYINTVLDEETSNETRLCTKLLNHCTDVNVALPVGTVWMDITGKIVRRFVLFSGPSRFTSWSLGQGQVVTSNFT